jgi:hypothetical protein
MSVMHPLTGDRVSGIAISGLWMKSNGLFFCVVQRTNYENAPETLLGSFSMQKIFIYFLGQWDSMVKVHCPLCKGEGRIPASEMAENIEDWIPCPECLGKETMQVKKEDRVKKTR